MNTKNVVLLCFIYYVAADHPINNEAVEMEIDAPEIDILGKLMDKLQIRLTKTDKLRNSLKPARVLDIFRVQPMPRPYCLKAVEKFLIDSRWPSQIVEDIVRAHNECTWPSGISNVALRMDNINDVKNYKCRYVPVTHIPCQAVIVFASDNLTMTDNMIAEPAFLMIFNAGGIIIE